MPGCGGGGASLATLPPPPPPPSISITVAPAATSVLLGNTQAFSAEVANTTDTTVSWSVSGLPGGNASVGTISSTGIYTAPSDLLPSNTVQITAVSHADETKSASVTVAIVSDISISVSPTAASVELGAMQAFQPNITSAGHPDTTVRWSLSGCSSACGFVDSSGRFVAPQILPSSHTLMLTAQSVADSSKQVSAAVTITSSFQFSLSAPNSLGTGSIATVAAMLTPVPESNPSTAVSWSLSGPGCTGAGCGVLSPSSPQSSGAATASTATYTAPADVPNPNLVTITATPLADPSKIAQVAISILQGIGVTLSPTAATLAGYHRVTLAAQVSSSTNTAVTWSVNGILNGNGTVGQICVVSSNPCQPLTGGSYTQVDYQAPGAIPATNPVIVRATSSADSTKSASAQITVLNHVVVTVQPASATLAPLATQGFAATVLGTSNQNVVWQVRGTACSSGAPCGIIDANGTYNAPGAAPSPNTLQIVAISSDDSQQSGDASVNIATGASILGLHPASIYAGGANGFTLRVDGSNFAPTSPGSGSVLLVAGTPRTTTCNSVTECTAPIAPSDVATPGNISIQIQKSDTSTSNAVSLVVIPPNASDEVIALTPATPGAIGKDIIVVEPTTAGVSAPGSDVDLNVAALGQFSSASNSCSLAGNAVILKRPPSGTATADICLFSEGGLDASMTYIVSGSGDLSVASKQPAGLGIIHLTLQIPASATPGARTLFVATTNLDMAAASGALEVN
jgi:hypothetical protein